jgi:hypothetical protein
MKTDLKPDIWRLVVIHLIGDVGTKDTKEKAKQQEVLAELSLVSKVCEAYFAREVNHVEICWKLLRL